MTISTGQEADQEWQRPTWEQVVTEHSARVYRLALRLTGNPHDAEDMLQNAFAKAYANWRKVRRADSPEAYVHRIVANETITAWRRRWRHAEHSTDAPPEVTTPGHAESVGDR